ncbi:hypothetical protein JCM9279_004204 [Rhodotorula babjevae]
MAQAAQATDLHVHGIADARALPQLVKDLNIPAVLSLLSTLELARTWAVELAQHLVAHAHDLDIPPRDTLFLEHLVADDNSREGAVRFSVVDLLWRRRKVEPQLRAGHLDEAQRSLTAYFTSPTSFFLQIFESEPPVAREHLATFSHAYQAYHDQCVEARDAHLRDAVFGWSFTGLKHNGKIDDDGHDLMTLRWAKNVVRLHEQRDFASPLVSTDGSPRGPAAASAGASSNANSSNSQDSLPTPDPSSDGGRAPSPHASTTLQAREGQAASEEDEVMTGAEDRRGEGTVTQEGAAAPSQSGEDDRMTSDEQDEAMQVDVFGPVALPSPAPAPAPTSPLASASAAAPAPAPIIAIDSPAPTSSTRKRQLRDSSVQTTPLPPPHSPRRSARLSPSPQPADLAAASRCRSPRARTRSPAPPFTTAAHLAVPAPQPAVDDDAESQPPRISTPTAHVASVVISSLIERAAQENQARLRRDRRATTAGALGESGPAATDGEPRAATVGPVEADEARAREIKRPRRSVPAPSFAHADGPGAASRSASPPGPASSRALGPTTSGILMPPPPLTARSNGEAVRAAEPSRDAATGAPRAAASSYLPLSPDVIQATPSPSQPSPTTQPRTFPHAQPAPSSSQPVSPVQPSPSSSSAATAPSSSLPEPAQPQPPRSTGPIPPVPGFTGSTVRSSPSAPTLEAPESAQVQAQVLVLGRHEGGAEDESSLEKVEPSPPVRARAGRAVAAAGLDADASAAARIATPASSAAAGAPRAPRVLVPDSQSSSGAPPPLPPAAATDAAPSSAGPVLVAAAVVAAAAGADSQGAGSGSGSGTSVGSSLLSVSSAEAQRLVAAVEPFDTYDTQRARAGERERERAQKKQREDGKVRERDDEWMISQVSQGILDDDDDDDDDDDEGDSVALGPGSTADGEVDVDELASDGDASDSQPRSQLFSLGDTQPFTQAPPRGAARDALERRPRRVSLTEVDSEGEADEAGLGTSGSGTDGAGDADDMRAIGEFVRLDALE